MPNPLIYDLARVLGLIELNERDYEVRNKLIYEAVFLAHGCGFEAGARLDLNDPQWPVFYIELPTGQISWHIPEHSRHWDGHSTAKKYRRVNDWIRSLDPNAEIPRGRRFWLNRSYDGSGISGTGIVALGFEFVPGGKCILNWLRSGRSIGIYDDVYALQRIHGHGDATVVEWLDN